MKVVKTAPTGKAAFNIDGNTLHSAFKIPANRGFEYCALDSDRLNTIRTQLKKLKLIFIDEISMVGSGTVLCKSNASEMREFRSLFKRTFQESSRESSSDNSRPFERNFPRTKNAFLSTFPYKTKFHDQKRRFTNSVPEISRWTDNNSLHDLFDLPVI